MSGEKGTILVTGDVMLDHHLYVGERTGPDSTRPVGTSEHASEGGAGLVFRILEVCAGCDGSADGAGTEYRVEFGLDPGIFGKLESCLQAYAEWKPFPLEGKKVWRMDRELGYGNPCSRFFPYAEYCNSGLSPDPELVLIDDAGSGFRHGTQKAGWPKCLTTENGHRPGWIVLKISSPLAQGDLWRHLSGRYRDRLTVIVSIGDIRREQVRVSRGISWERTALELGWELCANPAISGLLDCSHLIVSFGDEGALHVDLTGPGRRFRLFYDSSCMELESGESIQGGGWGFNACLTAGIADRIMRGGSEDPVADGVRAGLSAGRTMHLEGHGPVTSGNPDFPFNAVVADILRPKHRFSNVDLPDPESIGASARKSWTLMNAFFGGTGKKRAPLYGAGRRVAILGPDALNHVPFSRFGRLFTVDRNEIESLRTIRTMIRGYLDTDPGKKPLSLAVFGPPGAGKSFGIGEIVRGILGKDAPILEFNLSQFGDPAALTGAFHQVRDRVLQGTMPVVFWDEFDSREYFWLQYLLAPMQDGKFLEGQISHPIGKCVFVFAGGTSYTMENFGPSPENPAKWEVFKAKKGPDFISRLSGYLNVLGPNRRPVMNPKTGKWEEDPEDVCFPVRRALLLRSILGLKDGTRLDMDSGLLTAFIETDRYRHGSRSMEKIVLLMKKPAGAIRRSDLPAEDVLSLHTDAE
ncbi:ATP-binding protein, partial [bacterium]|nr:ATP-binding protein [bacterium]